MDEFPAGPASPGPRRPPLTVVIPVNNGGRDLERCLRGLRASAWSDYELIVVDDGSSDGSADVARSHGAVVIGHATAKGPAAARNAGALAASAPIVFFLDADVVPHPDALGRCLSRFRADPKLAALFGSYDDRPAHPGLLSQFRNLLHHYVHQNGVFVDDARPAHTFWTGCGAIQRHVFLELGGFDPKRYPRPAIEDIELGYRMLRAGYRVILARDIQGTHLKRWTLLGLVRTDIFCRGVPWLLLLKRLELAENDLNVSRSQKASVAAAGLIGLASLAAPLVPEALIGVLLGSIALIALNRAFYQFLIRQRGWAFTLGSLPLHYLYFCCCGASVPIALLLWHLSVRTLDPRPARERISKPHRTRPRPPVEGSGTARSSSLRGWLRR